MQKNRLIIVEGPQGIGKTTLTDYLRENIASANLYRLSGQKDKSLTGLKHSKKMYKSLLKYLHSMEDVPMDLIFDRAFFTEEVYSRLGYKEYSFHETYEELVKDLMHLNYDIYYFTLYLKDPNLYTERLKRNHHHYQNFSSISSVNQENIYLQIKEELKENTKFNINVIAMDDFDEAYKEVRKILDI